MGQIKVVCCGYYGQGNAGDEALLASLLQMLPKNCTPCIISGNPQQTQERYGVTAVGRTAAPQVLQALHQADAFIWGGGSLIQDATSIRSPLYYAGLMGLAQQLGLKTIALAQGIGPLRRSLTRSVARRVFAGCTAVSVRDTGSAKLLADWNIPFIMAPDLVWALEAKPAPSLGASLGNLPAPRVAVTLREHPELTPARLKAIEQALVNFQKATNTFILLVPFQASKDLAIAQQLATALGDRAQILTVEDPQQLKSLFQGVEMAVGMRLHSIIMAAAAHCKCFGISYDPKVTQLMTELDLPGILLSELPESSDTIRKNLLDCYANGQPLSGAKTQSLVEGTLMHQDMLKQVLAADD
ncbi:polysaccharide pyruvyl transferase CsaB [[Phormidium] sp. ETS-05]|uniref:polysaccharide pyruvyl transferase CsaB n=1 Tax=[Phormidium] sp. ETS-05 TaxID=222819 RepID=UPI0018EED05E|nr:polysaccharide pyruvyl transferase CsaB [[Phormidium] sp. ETS-05]